MSDVFYSTQICMETKWNVVRDDVGGYIYAFYDNNWLSYDDIETIIIKVSLYSHTSHTPLTCFAVCTKSNRGSFEHSGEPRI